MHSIADDILSFLESTPALALAPATLAGGIAIASVERYLRRDTQLVDRFHRQLWWLRSGCLEFVQRTGSKTKPLNRFRLHAGDALMAASTHHTSLGRVTSGAPVLSPPVVVEAVASEDTLVGAIATAELFLAQRGATDGRCAASVCACLRYDVLYR